MKRTCLLLSSLLLLLLAQPCLGQDTTTERKAQRKAGATAGTVVKVEGKGAKVHRAGGGEEDLAPGQILRVGDRVEAGHAVVDITLGEDDASSTGRVALNKKAKALLAPLSDPSDIVLEEGELVVSSDSGLHVRAGRVVLTVRGVVGLKRARGGALDVDVYRGVVTAFIGAEEHKLKTGHRTRFGPTGSRKRPTSIPRRGLPRWLRRLRSGGVVQRGLIAHWKLDQRSGQAVRDSAGRHTGQGLGDMAWLPRGGRLGGAMRFEGKAHVTVPHAADLFLDEGTVALWFRTTQKKGDHGLFSKDHTGTDSGGHINIKLDGDQLIFRMQGTKDSHTAKARAKSFQDGQWHHLTASFGPGGMRLYVDGEQVAKSDWKGGLGKSSGGIGNTEPIVLGASNSQSGGEKDPAHDFFLGSLDDVRIFRRALDPQEVTLLAAGR